MSWQVLAFNEEDALERVGDGAFADLILINGGLPSEEVLAAGRRIRERASFSANVPIIVVASKFGEEMEGKDVHVGENDWIIYLVDAEQLQNLIARVLPFHSQAG